MSASRQKQTFQPTLLIKFIEYRRSMFFGTKAQYPVNELVQV